MWQDHVIFVKALFTMLVLIAADSCTKRVWSTRRSVSVSPLATERLPPRTAKEEEAEGSISRRDEAFTLHAPLASSATTSSPAVLLGRRYVVVVFEVENDDEEIERGILAMYTPPKFSAGLRLTITPSTYVVNE